MTPHSPLSGHLNLYLPIQNLAILTTILFTPHKHMAHHNTIPNSATYLDLHTPTHATPTIATLFFFPLATPPSSRSW